MPTSNVTIPGNWYCARTKPKHEHIAAANLTRNLGVEVFNPCLRMDRVTRRGLIRTVEPLFHCYIFVRCEETRFHDIRFVTGVSSLVHFGDQVPRVPDEIIADLQECFSTEEPLLVEDRLAPGTEVLVADGAFRGLSGTVLRTLPAKQRVQILLEVLGRPTLVELDRQIVATEKQPLSNLLPALSSVA